MAVIWPAVESTSSTAGVAVVDPVKTAPDGIPRLGWLKILNISARNSNWPASPRNFRWVSFTAEKSRLDKPGALKKLRCVSPMKPSGCRLNAHGSNHMEAVCTGVPAAITFVELVSRAVVPQPTDVPFVMLDDVRVGSTFGRALDVVDSDNVRFVDSVGSNG